jgi:hypothetical protein
MSSRFFFNFWRNILSIPALITYGIPYKQLRRGYLVDIIYRYSTEAIQYPCADCQHKQLYRTTLVLPMCQFLVPK